MKKFAVALATVASVLAGGPGIAKELKMSLIAGESSAWGPMVTGFVGKVAELSGGELTIIPYWNSQLGNQQETLNMMLRGRLDIWVGPASSFGILSPESNVYGLPYVFKDEAEAICVAEATSAELASTIEARGHMIATYTSGWIDLASKTVVRTPDDVKGMKVRTGSQDVAIKFWNTVGAQAVPMPIGELNQSLATNLVSAGEQAVQYYAAISTNSVAPIYVRTNHYYNIGGIVISTKAWQGLTPEEQGYISKAAEETLNFGDVVNIINSFTDKVVERLTADGVTFIDLTEDEKNLWRAKGQESREKLVAGLSESTQAFYKSVQNAIATCRK